MKILQGYVYFMRILLLLLKMFDIWVVHGMEFHGKELRTRVSRSISGIM